MVDTSKLPEVERQHLLGKELNPLPMVPLVDGPPLSERRIAIITTAGLHRIDDERFNLMDVSYRVLPSDVKTGDLSMTHSSVHFDRTGFREDINLVYPIDRLKEMAENGEIGSVASFHYSFMGAGWPPEMIEEPAKQLAGLLKEDGVNGVVLSPV
jgi:D-proline reductase (dithiol) PrdB